MGTPRGRRGASDGDGGVPDAHGLVGERGGGKVGVGRVGIFAEKWVFLMVCCGLLWFAVVCCGLLWFALIFSGVFQASASTWRLFQR